MGVTRLKRKDRKNKARANNRVAKIKQLLSTPVIKNVDVEELKARFNTSGNAQEVPAPQAAAEKPAGEAPAPGASPAAAADEGATPPAGKEDQDAADVPSADEVFAAQEAAADETAAAEADALEPGDVESPGERFVNNQMADTASAPSQKDIDAIRMVEDDETESTTPQV